MFPRGPACRAPPQVSARLLLEMTRQALPLLKLDAAMRKDLGALQVATQGVEVGGVAWYAVKVLPVAGFFE